MTRQEAAEPLFDDSDEEEETAPSKERELIEACKSPFHEVIITHASYRTYKAVLVWLATERITFAPLTSSCSEASDILSPDKLSKPRQRQLEASPKSVYRLADFLSLPSLAELALSSFRSQLTVSNITTELFSLESELYDELGEACIAFAARHWDELRNREELQSRSGDVAVRLMSKLRADVT